MAFYGPIGMVPTFLMIAIAVSTMEIFGPWLLVIWGPIALLWAPLLAHLDAWRGYI